MAISVKKQSEKGSQVGDTNRVNKKKYNMNRSITLVKDLLRESQNHALTKNKIDIDKMFNLGMEEEVNEETNFVKGLDATGLTHFKKLTALRDQQKQWIPLFLRT